MKPNQTHCQLSLKINVIDKIASSDKKDTDEVLIGEATGRKMPIASNKSYSKSCDIIQTKLKKSIFKLGNQN